MTKKLFAFALAAIFIFSVTGAFAENLNVPTIQPTEKTKDRASRAMNNLLYGPTEVPCNIDCSKTKGAQIDRCIPKTQTGVERGIARVVGGVWQLATFWYSDPGCVTSAKGCAPIGKPAAAEAAASK